MYLKSSIVLVMVLCGLTACGPAKRKGPPAQIVTDSERAMLADGMDQDSETYGVEGVGGDFGGSELGYSDGAKLTDQDQHAIQLMTANIPNKIYFETNQFDLSEQSLKDLKVSAEFLVRYPNVHAMISGHADPRGSEDYNFHLAQRRANAVRDHLYASGIHKERICTVSYGELRPAASPADFGGDWRKAYHLDRRSEIEFGKNCLGQKNV